MSASRETTDKLSAFAPEDQPLAAPLPDSSDEQVYKGIAVSPGIAIGKVFHYTPGSYDVQPSSITEADISRHVERFEEAVVRSEQELAKIASVARDKLGDDSAAIFEAQSLMLRDSTIFEAVKDLIQHQLVSADYAVHKVMHGLVQRMERSDSPYLRERAYDLVELEHRVVRNLYRRKAVSQIKEHRIVTAEKLTAADIVLFSRREILGCALDFGGATSHVAIMARSLGVPAVMGLHDVSEHLPDGSTIILDGVVGQVITNPTETTLASYKRKQEKYELLVKEQLSLAGLPSETCDGHPISLQANIDVDAEVALIQAYGAHGIGLLRSELLFLSQGLFPSEQHQFEKYREILQRVSPGAVTIRLFDLGGDKVMPIGHREPNPFLGWRGIRVLLDREEVLRYQLRAILRASAFGSLRLLIPVVTTLDDVRRFKALLEAAKADLDAEGIAYDDTMPVGIMVEVPSVALNADAFAAEVDFFSIGTNDLTQYTLAVDRGNDLVSDRYNEMHPAVLRLIQMTVDAAQTHGIDVSICGELAGRARAVPILIGLGLRRLSASPLYLPQVKRIIRALRIKEAETLATYALHHPDPESVRRRIDAWMINNECGAHLSLND
ncbi:MAG: phosphoenolpyruvate--protein phosphotransferase [Bacteroidota bacterium]